MLFLVSGIEKFLYESKFQRKWQFHYFITARGYYCNENNVSVIIKILSQWHAKICEALFGKNERGEQLTRKKKANKNKIEEREITTNMKMKIRNGFLKGKCNQDGNILGKNTARF